MASWTRSSVSLFLSAVVLAAPGSSSVAAQDPDAGEPIPNGPDAKVNAQFREGYYRFYLQLAEAYRQHTADAAELKPLGVELLMEVARKRALDPSSDDLSRLRQLAQQLIAQGSQDPLVLQRQARLETLDGQHDAARTRLLACEDKWSASAYPPLASLLNSYYLCSLASAARDSDLLAEYFPRFVERWVHWAADESKTAENRRYVVATAYDLTTDLREMREKNDLLEALHQREGLDGWVRNTIAGAVQMDIAWTWRGGDTAEAVSEAGWEKFGEHMKLAGDLLVAAWRSQPDRPEPASHMIAVAMAGHADESPRVWFDRAVAAEMDYPPAYLNLSNSLLPRWGGSPPEMVRFGLDCLRTQRFDTRVPLQLFTQALAAENETGRTDRFWRNPQLYAKLKEMFEGYQKTPTPTAEPRHVPPLDWVASMHAAVALRAGQWDDARPLIDKLQGKLLPEAMATIQVGPFDIARALALTGDVKDLAQAAEQTAGQRPETVDSLDRGRAQFAEAQAKNTDPRAEPYFTGRLAFLREARAFLAGQWAELSFDAALSNWRVRSGRWTVESERSAIGQRPITGEQYYFLPLELSSLHAFPPPYQLQVELEGLDGGFSQGGAGFVVGDVAFDGMRPAAGRMCWLHANAVGIDLGMNKPEWTFSNTSMMNAVKTKRRLDLRVWSGSLVLLADQQGPFALPAGPFEPGDRVGLGARHNSTALRVRFSGVRIRKLPYGPLMELSDHKMLLQEAAKMVDLDPDDWFARFVRGTTYFQLQRFGEALVDLRELARLQPDADGVFYYTGMTLAALKKDDEAVAMFQRALEKNPENHPVLRSWAELELGNDDPRFRNPRSALERALKAYELARQFSDAWECSGTLARAYAELGRWNDAILHAEEACTAAPPESVQVCRTQLAKYREAKRNSLPAAVASLLWEGDITRRVLGLALLVVLLAANLILVKRLARFGRLAGALAGTLAAAISFAIPAVMAVMVGLGEGPAFLKLLAGIVIAAAACGALAGVWAGAKFGERKPA